MGIFATGQVVLIPFPFSDLSHIKYRPALILAESDRGDWIACQITSKSYSAAKSIPLVNLDFKAGGLNLPSFAKPGKLFTVNETIFAGILGSLQSNRFNEIINTLIELLSHGQSDYNLQ